MRITHDQVGATIFAVTSKLEYKHISLG